MLSADLPDTSTPQTQRELLHCVGMNLDQAACAFGHISPDQWGGRGLQVVPSAHMLHMVLHGNQVQTVAA